MAGITQATFTSRTVHDAAVLMSADVVMGKLGGQARSQPHLAVHSTARFTSDVSMTADGSFGDSANDVYTFNGRAQFQGDVSLGDGLGAVTSHSDVTLSGAFAALGDSSVIGNASSSQDGLRVSDLPCNVRTEGG